MKVNKNALESTIILVTFILSVIINCFIFKEGFSDFNVAFKIIIIISCFLNVIITVIAFLEYEKLKNGLKNMYQRNFGILIAKRKFKKNILLFENLNNEIIKNYEDIYEMCSSVGNVELLKEITDGLQIKNINFYTKKSLFKSKLDLMIKKIENKNFEEKEYYTPSFDELVSNMGKKKSTDNLKFFTHK